MERYDRIPMNRLDFGLDPATERRSLWPAAGDTGYSENDAIWLYDEAQGVGVHAWLGHSGAQYPEAFERMSVFLPDGVVLARAERGPQFTEATQSGPHMLARCEAPFERWLYAYDGPVLPTTAAELARGPVPAGRAPVNVVFEAHARMVAPAFPQGAFFKDKADYAKTSASHFFGGYRCEQVLTADATLRIGDKWYRLCGTGLRTHRKGARVMQATDAVKVAEYTGHRWMHAVFPSGREIYHSWFGGADGVAIDGECFVRDAGITYRAEVRDPMPMGLEGAGARHSFTFVSSLGETPIDCEIVADSFQSLMGEEFFGVQWDSPNPACLAMSQAFVRYRWGDETAINMMERSVGLAALKRPG